jgi:hypothetical protein
MFYDETLRSQWETAGAGAYLAHALDDGIDEFIHLEKPDKGLLRIRVGYYDHSGYTVCRDGGESDGGTITVTLTLAPNPGDWEADGLVWEVLEEMVEAVHVVREVTDRKPKEQQRKHTPMPFRALSGITERTES